MCMGPMSLRRFTSLGMASAAACLLDAGVGAPISSRNLRLRLPRTGVYSGPYDAPFAYAWWSARVVAPPSAPLILRVVVTVAVVRVAGLLLWSWVSSAIPCTSSSGRTGPSDVLRMAQTCSDSPASCSGARGASGETPGAMTETGSADMHK